MESLEHHQNYHTFSHLLNDGWIFGRQIVCQNHFSSHCLEINACQDTSDFQYAHFRKHLLTFGVLSAFHPFIRWVYNVVCSRLGTIHAKSQTSVDVRMHRRTQFDVIFGLIFVTVLHGITIVNLMCFILANYGIVKFFPRPYVPAATWIFNLALLFARNIPSINPSLQNIVVLIPQKSMFTQWIISTVQFKGLMPGWSIVIKTIILRMISFNMDYYWSMDADAADEEMVRSLNGFYLYHLLTNGR